MKQICKGCFKPNILEYCSDCRKQLFNKGRVSSSLPFAMQERSQLSILSSYNKERTLKDIRIEYALLQREKELALVMEKGSHILKVAPTGILERLGQLPANEHLTMQIAAQVYNIYTAPNAAMVLGDNNIAYITRRFDITGSNTYIKKYILPELFAKSGLSYNGIEDIAVLLQQYLAAYKPQVEHLFAICILNYLFSCHGQQLFQFSLIESSTGEYLLSPAYNLLCTELHENTQPDILYTLENGEPFIRAGGYTYTDFSTLASRIGILPKRAERILAIFTQHELIVDYLIGRSFLDEESKQLYGQLYHQRLDRLKMR